MKLDSRWITPMLLLGIAPQKLLDIEWRSWGSWLGEATERH